MADLIDLTEWTREDLTALFARADDYARGHGGHHSGAAGLWFNGAPSVSNLALERAVGMLGMQPIHCEPVLSEPFVEPGSDEWGEQLAQLASWLDLLILSDDDGSVIAQATSTVSVPVVNAGSFQGRPCELLGELHALHAMGRELFTQRIVLVGPSCPSVRSWAQARAAFGLDIVQACPDELADPGLAHNSNLFAALRGADLVITVEPGEFGEQMAPYRIEPEYLVVTAPDCRVSPQLPFRWDREVATQLRDGPHGWVGPGFRSQLVALDQAVLAGCLGRS